MKKVREFQFSKKLLLNKLLEIFFSIKQAIYVQKGALSYIYGLFFSSPEPLAHGELL